MEYARSTVLAAIAAGALASLTGCSKTPRTAKETTPMYTMPDQTGPHEATWLQWPHAHQYGIEYRDELEPTWVAMTRTLVGSEKVHIIAYDTSEKARIERVLRDQRIPLDNVAFTIQANDDVWVRDNGPIFVRDDQGRLAVEGWGFNGWGKKAKYSLSQQVPAAVARVIGLPYVDLQRTMVNEGGAVEMDATHTLMATRSSILNKNRNPGMSQAEAEKHFRQYLGARHFIWLDGVAGQDITDMHIDGFAAFGPRNSLVTMSPDSLSDWGLSDKDIDTLYAATNADGEAYTFVTLPLTAKNVVTTWGKKLGYQGSYVNYYVANTTVLVPNYDDPNDSIANAALQKLYPDKKVVGIDARNLYSEGGMIHCVTQPQPRQ